METHSSGINIFGRNLRGRKAYAPFSTSVPIFRLSERPLWILWIPFSQLLYYEKQPRSRFQLIAVIFRSSPRAFVRLVFVVNATVPSYKGIDKPWREKHKSTWINKARSIRLITWKHCKKILEFSSYLTKFLNYSF